LELSHKTKKKKKNCAIGQMDDTKKVLLVDGGNIDKILRLATQNLHYVNVLPSIVSSMISVLECLSNQTKCSLLGIFFSG
jgi:large subunit ribosomal protein L4